MSKSKVFIAGGGTGGHIYPGIAIARAFLQLRPSAEIHFVGSADGLESKIVPREGFALHLIAGGKLNFSGNVFGKIKTLVKIPIGIIQSVGLILKHRPQFVLGVGGYASGPFVLAAALLRVPTAIWEPNAQPGLANRWLAHFVDSCYVVFADANKWLKNRNIFQFGMPLRAEIEKFSRTPKTGSEFHILSFGGSQGARAISTTLVQALTASGDKTWTQDLKVVHQIGSLDFEKVKKQYDGSENLVTPLEFIYDMPKYYDWADLVVARGGASTIMEIAAVGLPSIIIPLPLADDHQKKNAETLVNINAGRMILQKDLTPDRLIQEIQELRMHPQLMQEMSQNLKSVFKPQAARKIAENMIARMDAQ